MFLYNLFLYLVTAGSTLWKLGEGILDNQASDHLNWNIVPFVTELYADPTFSTVCMLFLAASQDTCKFGFYECGVKEEWKL